MKKYELTDETMTLGERTLYRIRALRDFADVKTGDLGGWIEKEENLSQVGDCWVGEESMVYEDAIVCNDAQISERAQIFGRARIIDMAAVRDEAKVYDYAIVSGEAEVRNNAKVYGRSHLYEKAFVINNAEVFDSVSVGGAMNIGDRSRLCGKVNLYGIGRIYGDAVVKEPSDYMIFREWWKNEDIDITWTRSNNMWTVEDGFHGTAEELIKKAYEDCEKSGREYERIVNYVNAILQEDER